MREELTTAEETLAVLRKQSRSIPAKDAEEKAKAERAVEEQQKVVFCGDRTDADTVP